MSRHCLTQIDLVTRTAVCSVCGPTEVRVSRSHNENPTKVLCVQRARENQEYINAWKQRHKSPGRPRHKLREIDEKNCTAVCAICGPTDVYRSRSKGYTAYRCATYIRAFIRQKGGAHIINPYATIHILSEIDEEKHTAICAKCGLVRIERDPILFSAGVDPGAIPGSAAPRFKNITQPPENTRIITEYKRLQACKRCGSMAVVAPNGFSFFEMHLPREQRISMLVQKATPAELAAELEKRELYCLECLRLVNKAYANNTPVPEFRPFPAFF